MLSGQRGVTEINSQSAVLYVSELSGLPRCAVQSGFSGSIRNLQNAHGGMRTVPVRIREELVAKKGK